jgi:hypothetical protein
MAYFQLSTDVVKWFSDIEKHYPIRFDLYYLCAVVGIRFEVKSDPVNAKDLIENFPGGFEHTGRLLIGLLLSTELRLAGVDLDEKTEVERTIGHLVDPASPSNLSDDGVKLMNKYAQGGFNYLFEKFADRPRSIETFIRKYSKLFE